MEAGSQKRTLSSLPVFLSVALIAVALVLSRSPLESSRPEMPAGAGNATTETGKVEARLWQDPLRAVLEHENTEHGGGEAVGSSSAVECRSRHNVGEVTCQIGRLLKKALEGRLSERGEVEADPNTPIVQILLTMVRDGTFAEDHERRLRNRYAVLTALSAQGLAPKDSEHIRYFKLGWACPDKLEKNIEGNTVPSISWIHDPNSEEMIIPFEWLERDQLYPGDIVAAPADDRPKNLLLMWLPESGFSHRPLFRLAQLIHAIGHWRSLGIRTDVIGPSYSGTLRGMVRDVEDICRSRGDVDDSRFLDVNSVLESVTIFSPWSTVSPSLLMSKWPNGSTDPNRPAGLYEAIPIEFNKTSVGDANGVRFVRTIGSDDGLALELIKELRRRGVDVLPSPYGAAHNVALISEWDTLYGQAFPLTFAATIKSVTELIGRFGCRDPNLSDLNRVEHAWNLQEKTRHGESYYFPNNLRTYSYIRAVDGRLPKSESSGEERPNEKGESQSKWTYAENLELPIGRGQLDYVRRLARKLKDTYDEDKPKAIGVVGSDVYDKLVLLHALREQFSDVILFMTDLDARMLHYEQFKWTRNAIVASNFGLELDDFYQKGAYQRMVGGVPPFRDNYQTALFFACRVALGLRPRSGKAFRAMDEEELTKVISCPRQFEIGRGRAVDLGGSERGRGIHPPRHNLITDWASFMETCTHLKVILTLLAIAFCVLLLVQISPGVLRIVGLAVPKAGIAKKILKIPGKTLNWPTWVVRQLKRILARLNLPKAEPVNEIPRELKKWAVETLKETCGQLKAWHWLGIGIKLAATGVVLFITMVFVAHYHAEGEPFSLVAGVSIWPGEVMRLTAVILSAYFTWLSLKILRNSEAELGKDFGLDELTPPAPISFENFCVGKNANRRWMNKPLLWLRYRIERISTVGWKIDEEDAKARKLWSDYLFRGRVSNRFFRLIPMAVTYVLLAGILMFIFGRPHTPYRGAVSLIVDRILLCLSVGFMVVLMFLVVDATHLCLRVVYAIIDYPNWVDEITDKFKKNSALETEDVEKWLDVRFIARLTEAVGKLLYFPFIVLLIMILARTRYFDNWNLPISLVITLLVYFFHVLGCFVALQVAAIKARRTALRALQKTLYELKFSNSQRVEQVEYLIEQTRSLRDGAFRPLIENPVIHILIPSGGMSLLALLKFLPLS